MNTRKAQGQDQKHFVLPKKYVCLVRALFGPAVRSLSDAAPGGREERERLALNVRDRWTYRWKIWCVVGALDVSWRDVLGE